MKKTLSALLLVFILVIPILSEYYTLEGSAFYVHFPKGYEDLAVKLMIQAEETLPILGELGQKGHLVIEDKMDLSNGYTTNGSYPLISFFPVFPDDVLMGGLGPNVSDWFEMLLFHEGTHLYHLEMQDRTNNLLSTLFGRTPLFYPIWGSPLSNIEGLAVSNETFYQDYGRGGDAIYTMILDAAIDADDLPNPKLVLGRFEHDKFDLAGFPYIYGWNFMEFLRSNYGPHAPNKLQEIYINNKSYPFMSKYDSAIKRLTGKTYTALAKDWHTWLKENYDQPQLQPEGKLYSNSGQIVYPGFFRDDYLYYAQSGDVTPGLYRINLDTEKEELLLFEPNIFGSIAPDRMGKIYYSKLVQDREGNYFYNIYCYDSGVVSPFITGQRAYSPFPIGLDTVYYLRHIEGKGNALYKLVSGNDAELIYQSKPGEEILQYVVGSTGVVFASVWREGGYVDLARIREGDDEIYFFTNDKYSDTYPVLSNDETTLFFQSNRDGRYGIWAYDLISRNVAPVANNHYGAFKPFINKEIDSTITTKTELGFVAYTNKGLRVGTYQWLGDADWNYTEDDDVPSPKNYPTIQELLLNGYTLKRYNSLSYLKPVFWMPSIIGASVGGTDPLQNYTYSFGYNYNPFIEDDIPTHQLSGALNYNFNSLQTLSISLESTFEESFINSQYQSTLPFRDHRLIVNASGDSLGRVGGGLSFVIPWGKKNLSGSNFISSDILYEVVKKELTYRLGTGINTKLTRNFSLQTQINAYYNSIGYKSEGSESLGKNILVLDTKLNYVFARPMWSFGASSTVWSEKMQLNPLITYIVGEKDWDIGFGAELTNTSSLMYGGVALTIGFKALYYPKIDKIVFSPVVNF